MEIMNLDEPAIPAAIDLVWSVFNEFEAPDYPAEGVTEFRRSVNVDTVVERVRRGELFLKGCYNEGKLVGVIAVRDESHISLLFVRKDHHRRGIARSLFEAVVNDIRVKGGISKITVNSSPYAVEIYHRIGFIDTDVEQTKNGIRFTPMVYYLP